MCTFHAKVSKHILGGVSTRERERERVSRRISMVWSSEIALHRVIRGLGQFWRFASIDCTLCNVRTVVTRCAVSELTWLAQFD